MLAHGANFSATLRDLRDVGPGSFVLSLGDCEPLAAALPGQFAMIRGHRWGHDPLLPRAFSILRAGGGEAEILAKAAGKASRLLAAARPGDTFAVTGPLGSSFPPPVTHSRQILVAGGVGIAPLLMHAEHAVATGSAASLTLCYGARTAADLVLVDDVARTGCQVVLATDDGSAGERGTVLAAVKVALATGGPATVLACGPEPMLVAIAGLCHRRGLDAYLSVEGEMACGIGVCLACAVPCKSPRYRYACKDGPVFALADLRGIYAPGGDSR